MESPLVSIIIPCYNAEEYIGEAIQSAMDQTYPHTEVIVIDDGSTDGSLDVIKSFGNAIRWETGPNRGGCAARNRGIELTKGEFIQFLDADDLLSPEKISLQIQHSSGADLVFSRGIETDLNGIRLGELGRPHETILLRMVCLDLLTIIGPLIRRQNVLAINGFRDGLPRGQERDLFLRLTLAGATFSSYLDAPLFTVRRVPHSVSSNLERSMDIYETLFYQTYRDRQAAGILSDDERRALADAMLQGATYYVDCGCRAKAVRYLRMAKSMHPRVGAHRSWKRRLVHRLFGFYNAVMLTKWLARIRSPERLPARHSNMT